MDYSWDVGTGLARRRTRSRPTAALESQRGSWHVASVRPTDTSTDRNRRSVVTVRFHHAPVRAPAPPGQGSRAADRGPSEKGHAGRLAVHFSVPNAVIGARVSCRGGRDKGCPV